MRRAVCFPRYFFGVWLLLLPCAGAQTRISIRPEPKEGQTLRLTSAQSVEISSDNEAAPARIMTEAVLGYKQTNGHFDDQGRMVSQLTIERIDMKQSLNGPPRSPGDFGQFVGRSMTAVFDRGGKLVDLQVPQDMQQVAAIFKQLVAGAYGALAFLPGVAMSIGETATVPSAIPLRLPGSTAPVPYQTRTVTTLRAVDAPADKTRGDRVAHFEQRIESAAESGLLKVAGTGTIDVNLDRGFVAASATKWTFAGSIGALRGAPSDSSQGIQGTMKITVEASE
jgi:hypothetical protein